MTKSLVQLTPAEQRELAMLRRLAKSVGLANMSNVRYNRLCMLEYKERLVKESSK